MAANFDPSSLQVTPEQTQAALAGDEAQLIDVRETYEWDAGRIDGALHIGLNDLSANAGKVDTDRPVVFVCRVGSRSAMAAQAFRGIGIDAYSMAGGLVRWADENRPLVPEGGHVADH
jgi:hydroxyacylglutathione hydrolase/adenylyltransferase/sulfurtransferase